MKLLKEGNNKKLRFEKVWTIDKANLTETETGQDRQLGNAERVGVQLQQLYDRCVLCG